MKSLLEAVAILMSFFLTPVIVTWTLIGMTPFIENIGDLPIDERETLAVCRWTRNSGEEAVVEVKPLL